MLILLFKTSHRISAHIKRVVKLLTCFSGMAAHALSFSALVIDPFTAVSLEMVQPTTASQLIARRIRCIAWQASQQIESSCSQFCQFGDRTATPAALVIATRLLFFRRCCLCRRS